MLPVSAHFLTALRQSHAISVAATLYRPSAPSVPVATEVVGGSLTCDIDARSRRQATLDLAFGLDAATADLLHELPFGGYAVLERGIRYADGSVERVPLGRLRIENVTWAELEGVASLTLADRMAQVADEPFPVPYTPAGLHPSDAIVACVQGVFGSTIAYRVTTTPASEPLLADTVYNDDRAAAISDLASSIGAEAYFDAHGDFVLRPRVTLDAGGTPVWTLDAGAEGVLVASSESLDRSSVRNGVAVRGQPDAESPPIYALAVDDDPASPTRWGGPFGRVALVVESTAIQDQAQADATARSLLNLRLGLSRTLELVGVPNPALEPGDLIEIVHADGRSEPQIVNALSIGLAADGDLALTTRANWRPQPLAPASGPLVHAGAYSWRELEGAQLVEA